MEACRQDPTPLEPPDRPLDDGAAAVVGLVEFLLARLVLPCRDHRLDAPPLEPVAHGRVAGTLVAGLLVRPGLLSGLARLPRAAIDLVEPLRLVTHASGPHDGQDDAVAIAHQVRFGAEAALRTSQRMVFGLRALRRRGPAQLRRRVGIFFSAPAAACWARMTVVSTHH